MIKFSKPQATINLITCATLASVVLLSGCFSGSAPQNSNSNQDAPLNELAEASWETRYSNAYGLGGDIIWHAANFTQQKTPATVLGLSNGLIKSYDGYGLYTLNDSNTGNLLTPWAADANPMQVQVLASDPSNQLRYYTGKWSTLAQFSAPISSLSANFSTLNAPLVLVGTADGDVDYYNGTTLQTLKKFPNQKVTQIAALSSQGKQPLVVAGLDNGSIQYFNGTQWQELSPPLATGIQITNMAQQLNPGANPIIVASYNDGSVIQIKDGQLSQLKLTDGKDIKLMNVQIQNNTVQLVISQTPGSISYYDTCWHQLVSPNKSNLIGLTSVFSTVGVRIVAAEEAGNINYFNGKNWQAILNTQYGTSNSVDFGAWSNSLSNIPVIMLGSNNASLNYYSPIGNINIDPVKPPK